MTAHRGSRLTYHVVDVFTDQPFAGNPLAVVLDADDLSTEQMQRLAAEFQLSETAFPVAPSEDERAQGADYRLRIFTPEVEVPFAGHPSVGTAWLMRELGRVTSQPIRQQCGAGLLPLVLTEAGVTLTGGAPTLSDPINPVDALSAVGLAVTDLVGLPSMIASAGLSYAVVPVQPGALQRCIPDIAILRRFFNYPQEATGVYVVSWHGSPDLVESRMFAGDIGSAEDAATGSAALALGVYLGGTRLLPDGTSTVEISQGVAMGRPSRLTVQCDVVKGKVEEVRVSGTAVHIAEGMIVVP